MYIIHLRIPKLSYHRRSIISGTRINPLTKEITMTYEEMVLNLAELDESTRQNTIKHHWQTVLSDGFIGYLQGQIETGQMPQLDEFYEKMIQQGMDKDLIDAIKMSGQQRLQKCISVWNSMNICYQAMQQASQQQGSNGGMVDHGHHTSMPQGVSVNSAQNCYRCGSPVSDQGLCHGCLSTQQSWEEQDQEYDRMQHEQLRQNQEYQRMQDDQISQDQYYSDQQYDFNSYNDY